ncbi:MAG: DNA polymerase III subunit [Ruminococcaceae bacterium]|nr:DNA polymerase III subunit [Oscillospiraceae bacterium]
MKLYGKDGLKARLDDIAAKGRLPHAILLSGHEGCGKKSLARYIAQLFLCENHACGQCVTCRNIEHDGHPDVIFVKTACGGKYAMEPFRGVLRSTVVKPNNGDLKVYIFEEADTMLPQHMNTLLKIIEEPPEHLRFIFTCENTSLILETILSRVTEFEVPDTGVRDCMQCLADGGVDPKQAKELSEMFAGNISKCRAVLDGGSETKLIETAQKAAAAIGRRDKFGVAAALTEQSGRHELVLVVEYLARILRDALALRCGGETEFFGKNEARKIAESCSENDILTMLDAAFEVCKNEIYNINPSLTTAYFTSKIFGG